MPSLSRIAFPLRRLVATSLFVFASLLTSSALCAADLFPDMPGWKKGEQSSYNPDNLYVTIDGAADLFLRYSFEEMKSVEYSDGTDSFTVEAYRHATPLDAFGIYSQGRPAKDSYLDIGVQGYSEGENLNFLAGRHYVEMRTGTANEKVAALMKAVALKMAESLNQGAGIPGLFAKFPAAGRKNGTEKYLSKDVLGYAYLKNGYQVDYAVEGKACTLLALENAGPAEVAAMLKAYLDDQKQNPKSLEGVLEVQDKFQGTLVMLKAGRYLIVAKGESPAAQRSALVAELGGKISK